MLVKKSYMYIVCITLYLKCIKHYTTEKSKHWLPIYISIYLACERVATIPSACFYWYHCGFRKIWVLKIIPYKFGVFLLMSLRVFLQTYDPHIVFLLFSCTKLSVVLKNNPFGIFLLLLLRVKTLILLTK